MIKDLILPIAEGQAFLRDGVKLVFHRKVGERMMITDARDEILLVYDDEIDAEAMPRISWFLQDLINSAIRFPPRSETASERFDRLERLDLLGAAVRDPASVARFHWAKAAQKAALKSNNAVMAEWIAQVHPLPVPQLAVSSTNSSGKASIQSSVSAAFQKKPSARTVIEWMNKLKNGDGTAASFVNKAGRPLGHSQLPTKIDLLVDRGTELFWEDPKNFPTMESVAALVERWWGLLTNDGVSGIGEEPPVYETTRQRIRRTETFENYAKRYGKHAAIAKFTPKGEPVEVTKPFERIYLDGVEYEHLTLFSDEWQEVAGKMKAVAAMDAFSFYKWRSSVFYGPFRQEMSLGALLNVMLPPRVTAADIEADVTTLFYGIPTTVLYDNNKADLPPSLIPSLMQFSEVELIGVFHPDGKSPLERSFRHDKEFLSGIKGRILPPKRRKDPRYKPAKEADMTAAQFEIEVERARLEWNSTPKASLGDRSPNDIMLEYLREVGVQRYGIQ